MSEFFWAFIYPIFIVGLVLLSPIACVILWHLLKSWRNDDLPWKEGSSADLKVKEIRAMDKNREESFYREVVQNEE